MLSMKHEFWADDNDDDNGDNNDNVDNDDNNENGRSNELVHKCVVDTAHFLSTCLQAISSHSNHHHHHDGFS